MALDSKNTVVKKTTLVATLSSALECYDFVIYAALIPYLSKNFFPDDPLVQSINTLLVFAVGYLSRPLGGLLFGIIGDKYGRKKTLIVTIWLMAISTFAIGLLPSYNIIGIASPLLLIFCRFVQGISQGGEVPGAIIFVAEHAPVNARNKYCAFIFLGLGSGALLSSFVCYLLSILLSEEAIVQWGWRIPFLFGGVLGLISVFIRRSIQETSHYLQQKTIGIEKYPALFLFKNCKKDLIVGVALAVLSASLITFTLTMPTYLKSFTTLPATQVYSLMSLGMLTMALSAPIFGRLSDRKGSIKVLRLAVIAGIFILPPSAYFATIYGSFFFVLFMVIIVQTLIGSLLGSFPVILANLFPAKIRYTGVAFSYNLASAIGAFIPASISYIILTTQNSLYVGLLFSFIASITFLCFTSTKRKWLLNLEESVFQKI